MESLKNALDSLMERLAELEVAARKLPNQNFADLIKGAHGRLSQASEHPDIEKVGEQLKADLETKHNLPFDLHGGA